mmetsp:Transcript_26947/g.62452  ORF Transcript_26947/g.62452 Transcript_26947/m.62452 type:complete len:240 (-) Transcript_26947:440-1159(-)
MPHRGGIFPWLRGERRAGDRRRAAGEDDEGGEVPHAARRRLEGGLVGHDAGVLHRQLGRRLAGGVRHPELEHAGQRSGLPHCDGGYHRSGDGLAGHLGDLVVLERGRHGALGRGLGAGVPQEGRQRHPRAGGERSPGGAGGTERRVQLWGVAVLGRALDAAVCPGRAVAAGARGHEALHPEQPGDESRHRELHRGQSDDVGGLLPAVRGGGESRVWRRDVLLQCRQRRARLRQQAGARA